MAERRWRIHRLGRGLFEIAVDGFPPRFRPATTADVDTALRQRERSMDSAISAITNVVIEFKSPGKFRSKTTSAAFVEALHERLLPYTRRTSAQEGIPESDYIGIAIDSTDLAFVQVVDGSIVHQNLLPITPRTFGLVVEACRRSYRRAITAENLGERRGQGFRIASAGRSFGVGELPSQLLNLDGSGREAEPATGRLQADVGAALKLFDGALKRAQRAPLKRAVVGARHGALVQALSRWAGRPAVERPRCR